MLDKIFRSSENCYTAKQVNAAHSKTTVNAARPMSYLSKTAHSTGNPQMDLQDQGVIDSGCSRHMTGNMSYLTDYEEIDGGYVAFGGNPKGGKITGKCTIKTGNLDFENVYFVRELKFNLFSVSQMCDKKNSVLFNDTECIVLSLNFKLIDESQVLLRVPRKNNMYSVDLKNIVPKGGLTCLFAKATYDESKLWHRRLGHLNFKTMNKLVKGNLVRGLPSKLFENDQTCVACQKGKQHRASFAERRNMTLIKAARTMLADSKLPTTFWAKAVNIACYVQNRVLVVKPHNKTPYELFHCRTPSLSFMRPIGCHVTILNTIDHLGKFNGKADEGLVNVGIKRLHDDLKVTAAKVYVTAAKLNLVLFINSNENYAKYTLLMGIPNEHQLKFNSIKDAKSLLQAVEKSSEVLDQTFDRLQKLISQLEIHSKSISQEDANQKFLSSLSPEWNIHTIVQPSSPQLDNEDLQQINHDDLEEIDFRWQMAMLTMRARRFLKNTRRKLTVNGNETIGFDKSKNTRRVVAVETTTSNALVSCDGSGYDWSDQAEEGPTNFAFMAYSSISSNSKVFTDSNCSLSCLENIKILKEQNEQLLKDLRASKLNAITYKTGLESVEARLLVYKKNKSVYKEDIKVLKREIHLREVAITEIRRKLDLAQKQKDEIQLIIENFKNSSNSLSKLIDCQIVDKCKIGLGYNAVPPPYTGNFMPPKPNLSFSTLEEFVNEPIVSEPTVKKHVVETSEAKTSEAKTSKAKPKVVRKNNGAPIIEEWVSISEEEDVPQAKIEKKTAKPSFAKIKFVKSKKQRVNTVKDKNVNAARPKAVVNAAKPKAVLNAVKKNQCISHPRKGNLQQDLQEKGVINSGCSRHMTGNMSYLNDFEEIDGGYVAFGGNPKGRKITDRSTIKTGNLDFEDVYFVKIVWRRYLAKITFCYLMEIDLPFLPQDQSSKSFSDAGFKPQEYEEKK
ncbi:ribonuclease H-like domain-containing protein, partial [Tanacetum coccineum]